jgi:hypothetical protein
VDVGVDAERHLADTVSERYLSEAEVVDKVLSR